MPSENPSAGSALPSLPSADLLSAGLENLLQTDPPALADGTALSSHQIDALAGTLTALQDNEPPYRFFFEHATGAGKTVAALGFIAALPDAGVLILTHRRNLVDQFVAEITDRGYAHRLHAPMITDSRGPAAPVTVQTYQWFQRNAARISSSYKLIICDEAHTALGEKTSEALRTATDQVLIGMTATGALIARHVQDLFPVQTSRFNLNQAARRGVIAPLRCLRIAPGADISHIHRVRLRRGETDVEFDQQELQELLDHDPFNLAVADLYRSRFKDLPGVIYTAGVKHAERVAQALQSAGVSARAVSGQTPKRQLSEILAAYENGEIDVLCCAQLLTEGWNSPRAAVCLHLAPTASRRVYQQRVGRITRRHPGKEAGIVVDFVHPATRHSHPVITLHSLLERDVYRAGAVTIGPLPRFGRARIPVSKRVMIVGEDPHVRAQLIEENFWRLEHCSLSDEEQRNWSQIAGTKASNPQFTETLKTLSGEPRLAFLRAACSNPHVTQRAIEALAATGNDGIDELLEIAGDWDEAERKLAARFALSALSGRGGGDVTADNLRIWRACTLTRSAHEQRAVGALPELPRLLGQLVNSSGRSHAQATRRLIALARRQKLPVAAAVLASVTPHTGEARSLLEGAQRRLCARRPQRLAAALEENISARRRRRDRRRRTNAKLALAPAA